MRTSVFIRQAPSGWESALFFSIEDYVSLVGAEIVKNKYKDISPE